MRTIFDEASEIEDSARCEAYVREACGGDSDLESEVRSLLASNAEAGSFLEEPAVERAGRLTPWPDTAPVRSRIGSYEILRELAHGGMGVVYLAERTDSGFRQTVALKLVRRGMDTDFILRRFEGERQILAALDHPNIARLLDGGSTREGQPYFVMEYIPGRHVLEDCDARSLTTRQRLVIFQQICSAVSYAHRNLVVHRDLKPANILVTPGCVPKLLDFGLARVLQADISDRLAEQTDTALRFLTPEYASPEQVRGERITTASDIYSLGVVLYELLTGHRPYRLTGRRPDEVARIVCEAEPEKPSVAIARTEEVLRGGKDPVTLTPQSVAATRDGDFAKLRRSLRGDLDIIVLMALRKEPDRRYASAEQFSEDIRRFLEGRPILARKDTVGYRFGKFVSRHKAAVAAAVLATSLLGGASVVAIEQARAAHRERLEAQKHFNEVRTLANSFLLEIHDAIKDLPGSTQARQLVVRRALEYLERLAQVKSSDPELRRELAGAFERVARVQGGMFESHMGDTTGALRSLRAALRIREELNGTDPRNEADRVALTETLLQVSQVHMVSGDSIGATAAAGRALALAEAILSSREADKEAVARLARARRYLGASLARRDPKRAMEELRAAETAFETLARQDASNLRFLREVAITNQQIVYALAGGRDREAASESYRRAVGISEDLISREPGNLALRRELAYSHLSMGTFLEWAGDLRASRTCYTKAVPLFEALVEADPHNAEARLALAEAYNSLGYAQVRAGGARTALENLRRSQRLLDPIVRTDPANARAHISQARLYESFATATSALASAARGPEREQWLRETRAWYARSRAAYEALDRRDLTDARVASELSAVTLKLAETERRLKVGGGEAPASDPH